MSNLVYLIFPQDNSTFRDNFKIVLLFEMKMNIKINNGIKNCSLLWLCLGLIGSACVAAMSQPAVS